MDDQSNLMRQLLHQISLAQNLGLGQLGEERRMNKRTGRQLNEYPAGQAGVGRQDEGQQLDRPTDMSQASASPTRSRLSSRNNMRERLGPRLDIHARLGLQGNVLQRLGPQGGQSDNHRNEDREERRSVVHSQTNMTGYVPRVVNRIILTMRTTRKDALLLTHEETALVNKLRRISRKRSPPTRRLGSADEKVDPRRPMRRSVNVARIAKVANVIDQQCA
ncbi:unnamed protein product [Prunus armeniaca]